MAGATDALLARLKAWTLELGGPGTRARLEKLTPPRNEYGVDPYGLDVDYVIAAIAPLSWLYKKYFRVQLHGADRVPNEGRAVIVANHSGQLPFDAAMIEVGLLIEKDPPRVARALVEKWVAAHVDLAALFHDIAKPRTRTLAVPGVGPADAGLVFVGEGPGADEDAQGKPFVGRAGQLLTKIIEAIDLKREDVYIANRVFTFDAKGNILDVTDVEGFPQNP